MQQRTLSGGFVKAPTATAKAVPTAPASSRPWVEKYRPRKLNDVVHQQEIVNALRRCLDQPNPNVPHMLFYGPPGTGKTTTALAVAYELYGPDYCRTKLKELNASDERGIAVVRDKIKKFCHAACTARPYTDAATGTHYKNPGFKLLVLDEADALMHDAQTALRRMMEDYASTTRFVLICNYVSRITDPIISRCSKFRFRPVPHSAAIERLVAVSKAEGVQLGTDEDTQNACFERITHVARGDLRLALNFLQSVGRLGPNASVQAVDDAAGSVPPERVAALFKACCSGAPVAVEVAVEDLTLDGYAGWQTIAALVPLVVNAPREIISEPAKAALLFKLSTADRALGDGGEERIQLLACALSIAKAVAPNRAVMQS